MYLNNTNVMTCVHALVRHSIRDGVRRDARHCHGVQRGVRLPTVWCRAIPRAFVVILHVLSAVGVCSAGPCADVAWSTSQELPRGLNVREGKHAATIERVAASEHDWEVLRAAERAPVSDAIASVAGADGNRTVDGVCVPLAASEQYANYFLALQSFMRLEMPLELAGRSVEWSRFVYRARVEYRLPDDLGEGADRHSSGGPQRSVFIEMTWEHCRAGSGMVWMGIERRVDVDARGNVLSIAGDGLAAVPIE